MADKLTTVKCCLNCGYSYMSDEEDTYILHCSRKAEDEDIVGECKVCHFWDDKAKRIYDGQVLKNDTGKLRRCRNCLYFRAEVNSEGLCPICEETLKG